MQAPRSRSVQAWLLLLVLCFSVLPRTTFHSCAHGEHHVHALEPGDGPAFFADEHCPVCDAPAPSAPAVEQEPALVITAPLVALGETIPVLLLWSERLHVPARGPPARA